MRKVRKDKLPDALKLVLTITKAHDRFKYKQRYEVQSTDELKKDADSFINAVLSGDTDSLKQDESITHRTLNRKVYMKDNY